MDVQIKTITIDGQNLTKNLFRQIEIEENFPFHESDEINILGYCIDKNEKYYLYVWNRYLCVCDYNSSDFYYAVRNIIGNDEFIDKSRNQIFLK